MALEQKLSGFEVLKEFTPKEIKTLATFIEVNKYEDGEEIIGKDTQTTSLLFILSGKVRINRSFAGGGIFMTQLGSKEVFGEVAFADQKERTASALSIGKSEIGAFDYAHFAIIKKQDAVFGMKLLQELMRLLASKFRAVNKKLDGIFCQNV